MYINTFLHKWNTVYTYEVYNFILLIFNLGNMELLLPNYVYKELIWWKNYIYQELIPEQTLEYTGEYINSRWFTWYEIIDVNDSSNKILVISKKTSSGVINNYEKVLIIKKWDLNNESFLNNSNSYEWFKHPNKVHRIDIDNEYLWAINESWKKFSIIPEDRANLIEGLREPQIWALYSILANYTISNNVFTIVMPTWTWKTETMLASLLKLRIKKLIVIVPTDALREQISLKFIKLWIFDRLRMIDKNTKRPVVWILNKTIDNIDEFVSKTNVIVTWPVRIK